jgi:hypothetical protein
MGRKLMSTAAVSSTVSSTSIFQELQSFYQSRQADVKQLGSDLQNGNLSGAQQAYNKLAGLGQAGPFANSEPFGNSSRAQAFEAVGQALQSGDLAGAQAAFATLTGSQNNAAASAVTSGATTLAAVVNLTSTSTQPVTEPPVSNSSIYQQLQTYQQQRQADLAQLGQDLQAGNLNAARQDFNTLTTLGQSGPNKSGQTFSQANRAQDFQAIGQALNSGDLAGAQSAFASLQSTFGQQNQQAQTAISAYNSGVTEIVINFFAPENAPSTQASATAAPVVTTPVVAPPVTEPASTGTGSTSSGATVPEIVINLGTTNLGTTNLGAASGSGSNGSTTPEIVIDLGQGSGSSAGSPEEVTINFGSGSSGAQISIDESQGQNGSPADQIIIDLNQQSANNYEVILNLLNSGSTSQTQSSSSNALSVSA